MSGISANINRSSPENLLASTTLLKLDSAPPKGIGRNKQNGAGTNPASKRSNSRQLEGTVNRSATKTANQAKSPPLTMQQSFAKNEIPKDAAIANLDVLLQGAGLKGPPKDETFWDKYVTGNERDQIRGRLHLAGLSVNPSDQHPKLYNRGFYYDATSRSVLFANSEDGARAFLQFMREFTNHATNAKGEFSEPAKKFLQEGLPLLVEQFGPKFKAGLLAIEARNKSAMDSGPMRWLQFLGGVETVLNAVSPLGMRRGPTSSKIVKYNPYSAGTRLGHNEVPFKNFGVLPEQTLSKVLRMVKAGTATKADLNEALRTTQSVFVDPTTGKSAPGAKDRPSYKQYIRDHAEAQGYISGRVKAPSLKDKASAGRLGTASGVQADATQASKPVPPVTPLPVNEPVAPKQSTTHKPVPPVTPLPAVAKSDISADLSYLLDATKAFAVSGDYRFQDGTSISAKQVLSHTKERTKISNAGQRKADANVRSQLDWRSAVKETITVLTALLNSPTAPQPANIQSRISQLNKKLDVLLQRAQRNGWTADANQVKTAMGTLKTQLDRHAATKGAPRAPVVNMATTPPSGSGSIKLPERISTKFDGQFPRGWVAIQKAPGQYVIWERTGETLGKRLGSLTYDQNRGTSNGQSKWDFAGSVYASQSFSVGVKTPIYRVAVYDSSNGGVLASKVIQEVLRKKLGQEVQIVVVGHHGDAPFGNKPPEQVAELVHNGLVTVDGFKVDQIIIACNTACTTLDKTGVKTGIRSPIVDIIPITSRAIVQDGGAHPAVLSTEATRSSNAYQDGVNAVLTGKGQPRRTVQQVAAPDLADLVNQRLHLGSAAQRQQVQEAVNRYVAELNPNTTSLWLCCTHYPALKTFIEKALTGRGMKTKVVDPMPIIANDAANSLIAMRKANPLGGQGVREVPPTVVTNGSSGTNRDVPSHNVQGSVNDLTDFKRAVIHTGPFGEEYPLVNQALDSPKLPPKKSTTDGLPPSNPTPPSPLATQINPITVVRNGVSATIGLKVFDLSIRIFFEVNPSTKNAEILKLQLKEAKNALNSSALRAKSGETPQSYSKRLTEYMSTKFPGLGFFIQTITAPTVGEALTGFGNSSYIQFADIGAMKNDRGELVKDPITKKLTLNYERDASGEIKRDATGNLMLKIPVRLIIGTATQIGAPGTNPKPGATPAFIPFSVSASDRNERELPGYVKSINPELAKSIESGLNDFRFRRVTKFPNILPRMDAILPFTAALQTPPLPNAQGVRLHSYGLPKNWTDLNPLLDTLKKDAQATIRATKPGQDLANVTPQTVPSAMEFNVKKVGLNVNFSETLALLGFLPLPVSLGGGLTRTTKTFNEPPEATQSSAMVASTRPSLNKISVDGAGNIRFERLSAPTNPSNRISVAELNKYPEILETPDGRLIGLPVGIVRALKQQTLDKTRITEVLTWIQNNSPRPGQARRLAIANRPADILNFIATRSQLNTALPMDAVTALRNYIREVVQ